MRRLIPGFLNGDFRLEVLRNDSLSNLIKQVTTLRDALPEIKERWRVMNGSSKCYEPYIDLALKFFHEFGMLKNASGINCSTVYLPGIEAGGPLSTTVNDLVKTHIVRQVKFCSHGGKMFIHNDRSPDSGKAALVMINALLATANVMDIKPVLWHQGVRNAPNPFVYVMSQVLAGLVDTPISGCVQNSVIDAEMDKYVAGYTPEKCNSLNQFGDGVNILTLGTLTGTSEMKINSSMSNLTAAAFNSTATAMGAYHRTVVDPTILETLIYSLSYWIRGIEGLVNDIDAVKMAVSMAASHPSGHLLGTGYDLARSYLINYIFSKRRVVPELTLKMDFSSQLPDTFRKIAKYLLSEDKVFATPEDADVDQIDRLLVDGESVGNW